MTVAEYRIVRTGRPDVCAVEHRNPRRRNWRHVGYVSEREADSLMDRAEPMLIDDCRGDEDPGVPASVTHLADVLCGRSGMRERARELGRDTGK